MITKIRTKEDIRSERELEEDIVLKQSRIIEATTYINQRIDHRVLSRIGLEMYRDSLDIHLNWLTLISCRGVD